MILDKAATNPWQALASASVFIFFALTFAVPSGYSYGAALLLLTSFGYLCSQPQLQLSAEDKALMYLLLAFFLVSLSTFVLHGNELKTLDQSSRYLLFVPILFLLIKIPPSPRALWLGLIMGTLSAFGLALWQRYMQGNPRPDGFMTSAIPFGNLSLMAGTLCLAGLPWANAERHHHWRWKIALCVAFVSGLYVSLLSGSRGGWLAIPIILLIFLVAFVRRAKMRTVAAGGALLLGVLLLAGISMREEVTARYDMAVSEVQAYIVHGNAETSVGVRLEAWRAALANIAEKPILGWSYKDYDARLHELAAERRADIAVTTLANTHNNFLEVWLYQGIFGLLAFLGLFIAPFIFFCKRLRHKCPSVQALALGGACLAGSVFVFCLTQVFLGRNNGIIFYGITLVIFWGSLRALENEQPKTNSRIEDNAQFE